MTYSEIKEEIKNRHESTKDFTKRFYEDYKESTMSQCSKNYDRDADTYIRDGIILVHAHDRIYESDFYNKNSTAYCVFLEIVNGKELK